MPSIYSFEEYNPEWPARFEAERAVLEAILGNCLIRAHHIGSTSVKGLAAKPIIDLLPVVDRIGRVDELTSEMESAGYKAWGEYGLPGRRLLTRDREGVRTHNVHIYEDGHDDIHRHVVFADYLRSDSAVAAEYALVKREAHRKHPADIQAYNDAKSGWILQTEIAAAAWDSRQSLDQAQ